MRLLESIIGNVNQPEWVERLAGATIDVLALDQWEAQKNRFRKPTRGGVEVAISLDRTIHLRNGDILAWDETTRAAIVAEIELNDVLIVDLSGLTALPPEETLRTAVELGHALGNQHWPAVMQGLQVYVPLTVDHKVMASVMRTHAFPGVTYSFAPGAEVIPYLAPHEARRLFGGAEGPPHKHTHEQSHPHG
jgi:urease accessory protein